MSSPLSLKFPDVILPLRSFIKKAAKRPRSCLRNLKIGTKIGLGYTVALGIATLGTVMGSLVGNQIQQQASLQRAKFYQSERLIHELQIAILDVRSNEQRLMRMLHNPKEEPFQYSIAKIRLNRANILLMDFGEALREMEANPDLWGRGAGVAGYLKMQQPIAIDYLNELKWLMDQNVSSSSTVTPEAIAAALNAFSRHSATQQLDEFASQLNELVIITKQLEDQSEQELIRVERLRQQILFGSMALSGLLAIFFATYTTRAIARPLWEVTRVARQVTEEANFDWQAPVISRDEVGILATSLNQLIVRVKELLQVQQQAAEEQRRLQQQQLLQAEKMSSLGRMLAGVAHEINNPINFMYGNLIHARGYIHDLMQLLEQYQATVPHPDPSVIELARIIDLEFLSQDLPKLLNSMQVGADRTRQIVLSLKNFSRMDEEETHAVNLVACLDSTLLILSSRLSHGIQVVRHYDTVPEVEGYSGLIYQVLMNLLINALDALDEKQSLQEPNAPGWKPTLTIRLEQCHPSQVTIGVADNGCGIPTERLSRIFEAFYTSKPVGVGTGLGLSITKDIIETKHQGAIACHSREGEGTEFVLTLPIQQPARPGGPSAPSSAAQPPEYERVWIIPGPVAPDFHV